MAIAYDFQQAGMMALTAINDIAKAGGSDTTISGNATVALLIAGILALGPTAGAAPDALREIANGIQIGFDAGLYASTHTYTTIAGFAAGIAAQLNFDISTTFTGYLPQ